MSKKLMPVSRDSIAYRSGPDADYALTVPFGDSKLSFSIPLDSIIESDDLSEMYFSFDPDQEYKLNGPLGMDTSKFAFTGRDIVTAFAVKHFAHQTYNHNIFYGPKYLADSGFQDIAGLENFKPPCIEMAHTPHDIFGKPGFYEWMECRRKSAEIAAQELSDYDKLADINPDIANIEQMKYWASAMSSRVCDALYGMDPTAHDDLFIRHQAQSGEHAFPRDYGMLDSQTGYQSVGLDILRDKSCRQDLIERLNSFSSEWSRIFQAEVKLQDKAYDLIARKYAGEHDIKLIPTVCKLMDSRHEFNQSDIYTRDFMGFFIAETDGRSQYMFRAANIKDDVTNGITGERVIKPRELEFDIPVPPEVDRYTVDKIREIAKDMSMTMGQAPLTKDRAFAFDGFSIVRAAYAGQMQYEKVMMANAEENRARYTGSITSSGRDMRDLDAALSGITVTDGTEFSGPEI